MRDPRDLPDWGAALLEEVRAARAAGRELQRDDLLEMFLRYVPKPSGRPMPTVTEIKALVAPYEKDLERIMAETAAAFSDGMANPAFGDELGKRVKAFMDSRRGNADGASA